MTPPSAVTSIIFQPSRLQHLPSLQTLQNQKPQAGQSLRIITGTMIRTLSILTRLTPSIRKDHLANPLIYFLNNTLEEVQSLKLMGLTISHDLSWAKHISKLAPKPSCQLSILHRTKSFLGTPEVLSTYKAFICSLMEYCSPLWAGSPASQLA